MLGKERREPLKTGKFMAKESWIRRMVVRNLRGVNVDCIEKGDSG